MGDHPWLKFYPADHRADVGLRLCSFAARGLWTELLCLMHEGTPYGHLRIGTQALTTEQVAAMVGADPQEVTHLLKELEGVKVFSRTKDGTIFSRRMVRDEKLRRKKIAGSLRAQEGTRDGIHEGGHDTSHNGDHPYTRAQSPRSQNLRNHKPKARHQRENKSAARALSPTFVAFWNLYPRKKGHGAALRAWEDLAPDPSLQARIMQALHHQIDNDPDWSEGIIPAPAKWLREECYFNDCSYTTEQAKA